jgi:hypothetical protein
MPVSKPTRHAPRRSRNPRISPKAAREAKTLLYAAECVLHSGNVEETRYWEDQVRLAVISLLETGKEAALQIALTPTESARADVYDVLADMVEDAAESIAVEHDGTPHRGLLVAISVAAWSRYAIPAGVLASTAQRDSLEHLLTQFRAHVLAENVKCAALPWLASMDHVPPEYSKLRALTTDLVNAALAGKSTLEVRTKLEPPAELLADGRFVLVGIVAPQGAPLFRWQEADATSDGGYHSRESCFEVWAKHSKPHFTKLLSACEFDALLPNAFFDTTRRVDSLLRPRALRAEVGFITDSLKVKADELRATIAHVGIPEDPLPLEYRVGFALRDADDIVQGVIWPIFSPDEAQSIEQVEHVLREAGVTDIIKHGDVFEPEMCEDCGAPLFADPNGDMVHPEWPLDPEESRAHYH